MSSPESSHDSILERCNSHKRRRIIEEVDLMSDQADTSDVPMVEHDDSRKCRNETEEKNESDHNLITINNFIEVDIVEVMPSAQASLDLLEIKTRIQVAIPSSTPLSEEFTHTSGFFLLREYTLPSVEVLTHTSSIKGASLPQKHYNSIPIRTALGANVLLSYATKISQSNMTHVAAKFPSSSTAISQKLYPNAEIEDKNELFFKHLGNTVEKTLIQVFINNNVEIESPVETKVRIFLNVDNACKFCSPLGLGRCVDSNPTISAQLRESFAEIFPDSIISDVVQTCRKGHNTNGKKKSPDVTAKMIYDCFDNKHEKEIQLLCPNDQSGQGDVDASMTEAHDIEPRTRSSPLQIAGLVPTLRPYQEAAVQWMLMRERIDAKVRYEQANEWEVYWLMIYPHHDKTERKEYVMPLYEWTKGRDSESLSGNILLYNPFVGWLTRSYNEAKRWTLYCVDDTTPEKMISGGILAESMGLGKTVETIACILANPCPENQHDGVSTLELNDVAQPLASNRALTSIHSHSGNTLCYCGVASTDAHYLSWVWCERCHEPLHGRCADFNSEQHLVRSCGRRYCSRQQNEKFICNYNRCPSCRDTIIRSRATLIVTPPAILLQWNRELINHTSVQKFDDAVEFSGLKVAIYSGVKEIMRGTKESKNRSLIHAHNLADHDIVLTTFDVLLSDLSHSDKNPFVQSIGTIEGHAHGNILRTNHPALGRIGLRSKKRYRVVPSPLTRIRWWRTVLDEAQKVAIPTASSAMMANKLLSVHKWGVSGTPINRTKLEDLFGLVLFLEMPPFNEKSWFHYALNPMHRGFLDRLAHLTYNMLWRSTTASPAIRKQLGIPEQEEKKLFLTFSSIEKHFYQKQLEATLVAASSILKDQSKKMMNSREMELISNQLRRLRAACCHPQVGSTGIERLKPKKGSAFDDKYGGILNMDQILHRLLDDARTKAEDAQRLTILHTNALACLNRLKAEALERGSVARNDDSPEVYILRSCRLYNDALQISDANSTPTPLIGEVALSGSHGLQSPRIIRDGDMSVRWNLSSVTCVQLNDIWCKFEFRVPKRICSLVVQHTPTPGSSNTESEILHPKEIVLEVSNPALNGMFVEVLRLQVRVNQESSYCYPESSCTNYDRLKSKLWRLRVLSFQDDLPLDRLKNKRLATIAIDLTLMESDLVGDTLQRLHTLHNFHELLSSVLNREMLGSNPKLDWSTVFPDYKVNVSLIESMQRMKNEYCRIESRYLESARLAHEATRRQLAEKTKVRETIVSELKPEQKVPWWVILLQHYHTHDNSHKQLCEWVKRALSILYDDPSTSSASRRAFPPFSTIDGLFVALTSRISEVAPFLSTLKAPEYHRTLSNLSLSPSEGELYENSHCHKCRSDWHQTGPVCSICKLEQILLDYQESLNDPEINCILASLRDWIKDNDSLKKAVPMYDLLALSQKFFEIKGALLKELDAAKVFWRAHFNFLSALDEMNQCKRSMRLLDDFEQLRDFSEAERAFVVSAYDISHLIMDHTAKQAMADANMRRTLDTVRFHKLQNIERKRQNINAVGSDTNLDSVSDDTCCICLTELDGDRAVLRCGHSFHLSPCIEALSKRSGGGGAISCPLRCTLRTRRDEVLIANERSKDDGSKIERDDVIGGWGTKVDRLIADLLDVHKINNEKSIIFSQWDDMLDVVQQALDTNKISYVRPSSMKSFGSCITHFREKNYAALLMNVKNGAEGLNLTEASHVFLVEPLLNHALDQQALSRVHRIGQTRKTFVHRYIIKDTIEEKIDELRSYRQEHAAENESDENHVNISAGGRDGDFDLSELQDLLKM